MMAAGYFTEDEIRNAIINAEVYEIWFVQLNN